MTDKIYSRKRIRFPQIYKYKPTKKDEKNQKKKFILKVLLIAIVSATIIIKQINPVFNSICTEKAKALATEIINLKSNNAFKNIKYSDLVDIVKDSKRQHQHVKN